MTQLALPGTLGSRLALVGVLARKNFQVKYKRAALGIGWALVQPTFQAAVLAVIFTQVFRVDDTPNYGLYVVSGVLPWAFTTSAVLAATTAVVDNGALVRKVAVPLLIFPVSAVGGVGLAFSASLLVLLAASALAGTFGWSLLLLPVAVLLHVVLTVAVGLLTGALHPAFRDIRYVVESLLLVGLYATPILYTAQRVPEVARPWLELNPMTGVLELYRAAVLQRPIDGSAVLISIALALGLLATAVALFQRRSGEFTDLV